MILIFLSAILGSIVTIGEPGIAKVSVTKTQEIDYYILTREEPLIINVDGPTWLRVYTRILWQEDMKESEKYRIIVERDGEDDRIVKMTAKKSGVSSVFGQDVSKWRSFYINVPHETHTYRFFIWRASSDTILLRFGFQSPERWEELIPISYESLIETIESEKIYAYYTGEAEKDVSVIINGPRKIKVVTRVLCDSTFIGENVYGITVYDGDELIRRVSYNTQKSETVIFKNSPNIVPSTKSVTYIDIGDGEHILKFRSEKGAGKVAFAFYIRGSQ